MINFNFKKNQKNQLLFLGAHPDDIEIGCGGTILSILSDKKTIPNLEVIWVIFSGDKERKKESIISSNEFLKNIKSTVLTFDFKDSFFPYYGSQIKQAFNQIKQTVNPQIIFTHYKKDLHQDHRLINELTYNTFRKNLILEYEIPKYDGDIGNPNVYLPLSTKKIQKKNKIIINSFKSQIKKHWFNIDTFNAIAQIRGIESKSKSGYAEAFFCRKLIINNIL
tara:strand:- start:378 stop:1043 length:666 start_codon:yes stop_codon:yes gene_type:complete